MMQAAERFQAQARERKAKKVESAALLAMYKSPEELADMVSKGQISMRTYGAAIRMQTPPQQEVA